MKRIMVLVLVFSLAGCINHTEYGKCVGLIENERDPRLEYNVNAWNAFISLTFYKALFPIFMWLDYGVWCPTGYRQQQSKTKKH